MLSPFRFVLALAVTAAFSPLAPGGPATAHAATGSATVQERGGEDVPELRIEASASDSLLTVDHYLEWERVSDPRISPDGSTIVYARRRVNVMEDEWTSDLRVMNRDGDRDRFLTEGSNPRWSPDGTRIAYLAEGENEETQIFVRWMDAEGAATQVTRVSETPRNLVWGPRGERLAFTMSVPVEVEWPIDLPAAPEGAEWTEAPRAIHRMHYRADRRGFLDQTFEHIFVVSAEGGTPRQITGGAWHVGARAVGIPSGASLDWTPDGRTIVFDGLRRPGADTTYRESNIHAVDLETREVRRLTTERGFWSGPVVSPDGRRIAYTGFPETDLTYRASELRVLERDEGASRTISGDLDRDPAQLHWSPDGDGVYFTVADRGSRNVHHASLDGELRRVTEGEQTISLSSVSDDGTAAGTRSAPRAPENVIRFVLDGAEDRRTLTRVNADILRHLELGEVEEIGYSSSDGTPIQGWVVKPPDFDPAEEYPLILHIHGGPHAMYDVGFSYAFQNYAANGYLVLYTNPRGSTGYGTEFGAAISQDYPGPDHEDLMAGVDAVLDRGWADAERLFVTGCSGGGVLSSWAIGQTDRFAAAAVRCPVTDWISMAGTSDIPLFTFNFFDEPFWENPESWLRHSPLMHVGSVTTPTLLMTGEQDLRTPMAQTEEYYMALKKLGVPTVMLRFHDEYHGTGSRPSNFMRTQLYIMDWFENRGEIEGLTSDGASP